MPPLTQPKHQAPQPKQRGRGFYSYYHGKRVLSIADLKTGHIFLEHSVQFDADNTIRITRQDEMGLNRPIVYARFYNPERGACEGPEMAIWEHDLTRGTIIHMAMFEGVTAR